MLSIKLVESGLEDLKVITRADFFLCDEEGDILVDTTGKGYIERELINDFITSSAESQNIKGVYYQKIVIDQENLLVLVVYSAGNDGYMISRIATSEVIHLMGAGKGGHDKEEFFRDLLLDNILPAEIEKRAQKLKIKDNLCRVVYSVKVEEELTESAIELLKNIFSENDDMVFSINETKIAIVKAIKEKYVEEYDLEALVSDNANLIISMINTELMIRAKVTYGRTTTDLKKLSEIYRESDMALEVVSIFYDERDVASYTSLGIGRLIHQLPRGLCNLFLNEVFGENQNSLTLEEVSIIDSFFENNLNVAETARMIGMNRTTLIYRLDRLAKTIGLDIRKFDDALVLKIAMMVAKYIEYLERTY